MACSSLLIYATLGLRFTAGADPDPVVGAAKLKEKIGAAPAVVESAPDWAARFAACGPARALVGAGGYHLAR